MTLRWQQGSGWTTPTCIALRGCIGAPWCVYCGQPVPARRDARDRLQALITQLRADLAGHEAA